MPAYICEYLKIIALPIIFGTEQFWDCVDMSHFEFYDKLQREEIPLTENHVRKVMNFYKKIKYMEKQEFNKIKKYLSPQSTDYFSNIFKSSSFCQ